MNSIKTKNKINIILFSFLMVVVPFFSHSTIKSNNNDYSSNNLIEVFDSLSDNNECFNNYYDVNIKVKRGDNFWNILTKNNINNKTSNSIMLAIKKIQNPTLLDVDSYVKIRIIEEESGIKCPLSIIIGNKNSNKILVIDGNCNNHTFNAKYVTRMLKKQIYGLGAFVQGSIYQTLKETGVSNTMTSKIIEIFNDKINFSKEIKNNTYLEVLFEGYTDENDKYINDGEVLFASISTNNKKLSSYLFTKDNGNIGYYSINGEPVGKKLLMFPVKNSKITSKFGMRKHPLKGKKLMHRGIDFGAPTGTNVHSTGDGVISFIGYSNGYGKYIKIKHDNSYTTLYAHLNSFAKNIKKGSNVKQGQVIAQVGKTGQTTGPHLHYEVIKNNMHIDPMKILKTSQNIMLSENEMIKFKQVVDNYHMLMSSINKQSSIK